MASFSDGGERRSSGTSDRNANGLDGARLSAGLSQHLREEHDATGFSRVRRKRAVTAGSEVRDAGLRGLSKLVFSLPPIPGAKAKQ